MKMNLWCYKKKKARNQCVRYAHKCGQLDLPQKCRAVQPTEKVASTSAISAKVSPESWLYYTWHMYVSPWGFVKALQGVCEILIYLCFISFWTALSSGPTQAYWSLSQLSSGCKRCEMAYFEPCITYCNFNTILTVWFEFKSLACSPWNWNFTATWEGKIFIVWMLWLLP